MTRLPGLDPEVLEDLRRREASTSEGNRARRTRNPWADAATVEIVERWPCKDCGAMVGVTQEAITAFAVMNAHLVTSGQRPIDKSKAIPCARCKRTDDERRSRAPASSRPAQQQIAGLDAKRPSEMPARKGRL